MDILNYKDLEIRIPTSFKDVPFGMYEQVHKTEYKTLRDLGGVAAKICGIEPEKLLKAPAEVTDRVAERIIFLFKEHGLPPAPGFTFEGVSYVCEVDKSLTLAEWVDIEQTQKEGEQGERDDVLSAVLAIICRPAAEEYDPVKADARAEIFKRVPCDLILPVLGFFLLRSERLEKLINAYSNVKRAADLLPRSIKSLPSHGGGIKLSRTLRMIIYYFSTKLLRYRLGKFSRSLFIDAIRIRRLKPNEN